VIQNYEPGQFTKDDAKALHGYVVDITTYADEWDDATIHANVLVECPPSAGPFLLVSANDGKRWNPTSDVYLETIKTVEVHP
jgi:hypothetical protein